MTDINHGLISKTVQGEKNNSIVHAVLLFVNCESLPHISHLGHSLPNNSFLCSRDIGNGDSALKCVTDVVTCCNSSDAANWRDERGREVQQGPDGAYCSYVTRGQQVISLNIRSTYCASRPSGPWICDIPDSSGETQSLYIYIYIKRQCKKSSHNY